MEELNRLEVPACNPIQKISFGNFKKLLLPNNIPLYTIKAGEQEILKIDFIFSAGDWNQTKPLIASATINMLQEGSSLKDGDEIAECFDFYGSYVYFNSSKHTSSVTVYCLDKYFKETMILIQEILLYANFPEHKLSIYKNKKHQQYSIEAEKVEVIAQKQFAKTLFGYEHPYGRSAEADDFLELKRDTIRQFHKQYINSENCSIIMAGMVNVNQIDIVKELFGDAVWNIREIIEPELRHIIQPSPDRKFELSKDNAVQSALRIGKHMISKYNVHYPSLQVLNTVLGGYFGSRLMSNIREDKGYTYGIGSGIVSHHTQGYFVIATQVNKDDRYNAIHEIYYELKRLRTETIPDDELELVKNYMLATMARNFDGAFALSDSLKQIVEYNLPNSYYKKYWNTIKNIKTSELKYLANTYINEDSMYEVIVG